MMKPNEYIETQLGFYGKLPGQGDFVSRHLPAQFLTRWDTWLQTWIQSTQTSLGEAWLEAYLSSPMWRFLLSEGTVNDKAWAGLLLPSVDRVGRYFPLTLVAPLPPGVVGLDWINLANQWYLEVEAIAMNALNNRWGLESLIDAVGQLQRPYGVSHVEPRAVTSNSEGLPVSVTLDFEEQLPSTFYAGLLDILMKRSYETYSFWWSRGTDISDPMVLVSPGLPTSELAMSFLKTN